MEVNNHDLYLLVLHALNRSIDILAEKNNSLSELWDEFPHSDDIIADEQAFKDVLLAWSLLVDDFT